MELEQMNAQATGQASEGSAATESAAVEATTEGTTSDATFETDDKVGDVANQGTSDDDGEGEIGAQGGEAAATAKTAANARAAEARRAREQSAALESAKAQARLDTVIAMTGGENPYTHEKITDERDVQEYLTMRQIEQSGGDPLTDFAKVFKQQMRASEQAAREQQEREQWYVDDRAAFSAAYPDVDLRKLAKDPTFAAYADGKVGRVPLHQIYHGYKTMMDKITSAAEKRVTRSVAQHQANRQATPGSLSGSGAGEVTFTREQVQNMTQKEVHDNYDQIMRDMKHWK